MASSLHRRLSRRRFVGVSAGVAAAAYGLSSASHRAAAQEAAGPGATVGSDFVLKAPEENAKRGGVLKIAGLGDQAHYDIDQSPSISNLYPQSPIYDNLIRFNPLDGGQTIIPDLAQSWSMSEDGLNYTFNLREGVTWHDGTPLTADDVVATFDRRRNPPEGVVSIRQGLYDAVTEIQAVDPQTVTFVLSEPRPFFLEALATGWSVVLQKASLDANNGDLRRVQDSPGTGPYRFSSQESAVKWVVERNPDYWNQELPYVDSIERIQIPVAKDRGTAVLTGDVDFADHVSVDVYEEALNRPDEVGAIMNPATWAFTVTFNAQKPPFDDARVRRAVHLAVDRYALAEAYAQSDNIIVGSRWCHPSSPLATPREEVLKLPGYRPEREEDIAEAQRLMAEAGFADGVQDVVLLMRGTTGAGVDIYGPAVQDFMRRNLNIESTIQPVDGTVYFDIVRGGEFNLTVGVPAGAINDPSDYWSQWFKTGAPQNYGGYSNPEFDDLLAQISRELNVDTRRDLVRQAEDLLDQECPMFFHGWGNLPRIWRLDMHGIEQHVLGTYMAYRYDTLWLDR
ncbi:MAG: ABC transporter substrate-binding protein [Thermomicrobiales bacterium]